MADYISIMLNGLFTGIGVISANELWHKIKKYKEHIRYDVNKEEKNVITAKENM
jgi:hypothetical protein